MRVISKADCPISTFETYQIVAEELSTLSWKNSELTENQLRRKFCYLGVMEQIEKHGAMPSIGGLNFSEQRNALEAHRRDTTATVVDREQLETLLDQLHK